MRMVFVVALIMLAVIIVRLATAHADVWTWMSFAFLSTSVAAGAYVIRRDQREQQQ